MHFDFYGEAYIVTHVFDHGSYRYSKLNAGQKAALAAIQAQRFAICLRNLTAVSDTVSDAPTAAGSSHGHGRTARGNAVAAAAGATGILTDHDAGGSDSEGAEAPVDETGAGPSDAAMAPAKRATADASKARRAKQQRRDRGAQGRSQQTQAGTQSCQQAAGSKAQPRKRAPRKRQRAHQHQHQRQREPAPASKRHATGGAQGAAPAGLEAPSAQAAPDNKQERKRAAGVSRADATAATARALKLAGANAPNGAAQAKQAKRSTVTQGAQEARSDRDAPGAAAAKEAGRGNNITAAGSTRGARDGAVTPAVSGDSVLVGPSTNAAPKTTEPLQEVHQRGARNASAAGQSAAPALLFTEADERAAGGASVPGSTAGAGAHRSGRRGLG